MKQISILGSTGSIGTQTLAVISAFPDDFKVVGLSAGSNIDLLKTQIQTWKPRLVSIADEKHREDLEDFIKAFSPETKLLFGKKGLIAVATHPDNQLLVVAIVGTTSLEPTYAAISANIPIALACKEVLVAAGEVIMPHAKEKGVPILPIDSEHAAIKQCLAGVYEDATAIHKLILTASGGPFWKRPADTFDQITLEDALNHPNWRMGQKITIDSATLMNKGLEVIEAHHLFNMPYEKIDVVIHPQSIIHSMVEFTDGTLLSQMGLPDMRFPIQYVLNYPKKKANPWPKTHLTALKELTFHAPDLSKFPLLEMALDAGRRGGTHPVVLNAANEAIVGNFLQGKITFNDIPKLVGEALNKFDHYPTPTLQEIIAIDMDIKQRYKLAYA